MRSIYWGGILVALMWLAVPGGAQAQTPPTVVTNPATAKARWTYLQPSLVTRFELRVDGGIGGAWVDVGLGSKSGETYAAPLPGPIADGLHTLALRACNNTRCSDELSVAFRVETEAPPLPTSLELIVTLPNGQALRLRVPVEQLPAKEAK